MLRPLAAIFLLLCFAALGSGALARLHDLHHEHEDCGGQPGQHDEHSCTLHALLRTPIILLPTAVTLLLPGMLLSSVSLPAAVPAARRWLGRLDCRGPPVLS